MVYFLALLMSACALFGGEADAVYRQIADLFHPTIEDYQLIQSYLSSTERRRIVRLQDYAEMARSFKIIDEGLPCLHKIAVNCAEEERENCIIAYASFNKNYPAGLQKLAEGIARSDFKGHLLYRLGGWPNAEGGSLVLAHVPYAFKVCFFKEAERLGYKRVLWLDTSIIPLASLNAIFEMIEEKKVFAVGNIHMVGPYFCREAALSFGINMKQAYKIPSCSAGIFGVDLTSEIGREVIERWYRAAQDETPFYSSRPEQNALSVILFQLGLSDFLSLGEIAHHRDVVRPHHLFLIDREFVRKQGGK